ncbi:MAG: GNAT family N-acetyltransferase [Clostridia bacterium]|nr:GNAT family N-acetyltransferase [Clostridia bacterium]
MKNEMAKQHNYMITLRHFNKNDIPELKNNMFVGKTDEEIISVLSEWDNLEFKGKYSEFFAVICNERIVGYVSLYQHNDYIISVGPEIFLEYRRKGYAYEALKQAYDYAKGKGYKVATAQVRNNNIASIKLHEKLGFVLDCEMINRHGNEVYIYIKLL